MDENKEREALAGALDSVTICGKTFLFYNGSYHEAYNPYQDIKPYEFEIDGLQRPLYKVKIYNELIYQVIKFKLSEGHKLLLDDDKKPKQTYDEKLDNSFARAKSMVKQYGLCNPWEYFVTLTLDEKKYNRFDLNTFKKDLMQFIRDERKRYKEKYGNVPKLQVLFVPENHKNGAWHIHGLINGLPKQETSPFKIGLHPEKLVKNGFLNWPRYGEKFGFVSLGKIKNQFSTVMYICKYINKNVEALREMKGQHLYMASRPLRTAQDYAECYVHNTELESKLSYAGKFCAIGTVNREQYLWDYQGSDIVFMNDWSIEKVNRELYEIEKEFVTAEIDPEIEYEQPLMLSY